VNDASTVDPVETPSTADTFNPVALSAAVLTWAVGATVLIVPPAR